MATVETAAPSSAVNGAMAVGGRLVSIDVLRGLLVAGMVLVSNPGTYDFVYWPLKHADWNGTTPTDMIFPSFLFLAGVSMVFSFAARERRGEGAAPLLRHVFGRSLRLIVVGLLLNLFDLLHVQDWRLPGVLQRIGLCYCFGGLLYLALRRRSAVERCVGIAVVALLLVATYWTLQTRVPVPGYGVGRLDPAGTLSAYLDRAVFTTKHLWHWGGPGQMWDPEGLLTTLPAIANLLLGIVAGEWLRSAGSGVRRVVGLVGLGAALLMMGFLLDPVIVINKKIWTPSFVLVSGGFSLVAMGILYGAIDLAGLGEKRWARAAATPALIYGSNAVLGFALANMISPVLGILHLTGKQGKPVTIPQFGYEVFSQWLDPWNASLACAVVFVAFIAAILWPLYRRRIFIRL